MTNANSSAFSVREQVTTVPSVSISRNARTVVPNGPYRTGQLCALTLSVPPTLKSLFDCITATENPSGSRARIRDSTAFPHARDRRDAAVSGSHFGNVSDAAIPFRGKLWPPMECRAPPTQKTALPAPPRAAARARPHIAPIVVDTHDAGGRRPGWD